MRRGLTLMAIACLLSCTSGSGAVATPSISAAPPAEAGSDALSPYFGSYSTTDGDILVIARMGWFFDMRDATYRTIYATPTPNRFTIGLQFFRPLPKFADLVFDTGTLTVTHSTEKRTASRIKYKETDVHITANGAQLAGTITEPLSPAPHPGIVVIHGSEPGERFYYDIWVGVYASMGLVVLTYDKRGNGASTGKYPGEFPTDTALSIYADDANAALGFLGRWPSIDPKRVGFHGGSQGGWTVPLAIMRNPNPAASFAVLVSAPATTVDQTDLWAGFSGGGQFMPTQSLVEMQTAVRASHSGYDPAPALKAMRVPTLWLLGTNDRTVPTAICVEILSAMNKPNFTVHLIPTGHGLLVNPTGLAADDERSPGLAPDLVPAIKAWLRSVASI
jgi:dienelactone hydrolase